MLRAPGFIAKRCVHPWLFCPWLCWFELFISFKPPMVFCVFPHFFFKKIVSLNHDCALHDCFAAVTYLLHTEAVLGLTGWLCIELQATTSWSSPTLPPSGHRVFIFEEECIILIVRNAPPLYGVGIKWPETNVSRICSMATEVLTDKDDHDTGI